MKHKEEASLQSGLGTAPAGGSVQIGSIVAYVGVAAPSDWLLCNGSAIPAQYTQLRTLIGGENPTTPNLTGRTLIGAGIGWTAGSVGGETTHTLSTEEIPSHQHFGWGEASGDNWGGTTGQTTSRGFTGSNKTDTDNYLYGSTFAGGTPNDAIPTSNGSTNLQQGTTVAHNNMQPYYVINYIIYAGTN